VYAAGRMDDGHDMRSTVNDLNSYVTVAFSTGNAGTRTLITSMALAPQQQQATSPQLSSGITHSWLSSSPRPLDPRETLVVQGNKCT
jgi:hypothetical protein